LSIANYKQGNLSIEQFYAGFMNLWSEYTGIIYSKVPKESLEALHLVHADSQRDQFLMKLRPEFEAVRASLINRNPVPSLDDCLGEILREEQRLATQHELTQPTATEMVNMAYMAQGKGRQRGVGLQCYNCKESGHIARNCSKKFCNYCKKEGHVIRDCRMRPQHRQGGGMPMTTASMAAAAVSSSTPEPSSTMSSSSTTLTPEMVEQMIVSALSAFGFQGMKNEFKSRVSTNIRNHLDLADGFKWKQSELADGFKRNQSEFKSDVIILANDKTWLMDLAASNHMKNSENELCNVQKYMGNQHIQVANGDNLPISSIGDLGLNFKDIFVSPKLSANLLSVGQMVENNCEIRFNHNGCCVQDQVSGKVIAKGPKVGRLFPLQFSSINSCAYSTFINNHQFWHKKLGHPNSIVLTHLMRHGYLGNKNSCSTEFLDCSSCKLGKSKSLSFPSHGSRASKCFDIIHTDV
jgi:hypothetical protein